MSDMICLIFWHKPLERYMTDLSFTRAVRAESRLCYWRHGNGGEFEAIKAALDPHFLDTFQINGFMNPSKDFTSKSDYTSEKCINVLKTHASALRSLIVLDPHGGHFKQQDIQAVTIQYFVFSFCKKTYFTISLRVLSVEVWNFHDGAF